ncbi:NAD(P)-dependent dehydrogenase (short-subunit alcohol dehydrogenase family) [Salana multivorans]|uniref:NAD(P)-dependent dehydrogenase (Short-subunit alcohol dehydrogenase family) n=1 Tax=Salana multivorans TaxID=120377 RepID=A0A3N2D979_9MICO|nr:SDR family NAD(P)-dependent oxidoreductase [Salana multivorans]ROR96345.1 NAD(P)-dependent dehydrogenase (short-subunit alcohol dehydrogenase family) [Salana multivorans]
MALTAGSTIKEWLDDPTGGELLRGLLAAGGADAESLAPVHGLPLQQLVVMSQGRMPQEAVDDLVRRANGGVIPEDEEPTGWVEVITPGRFAGRTVVVTGAASGIGRATTSRLVREGARVVAVDISAERLDALVADLGEAIVPVAADVTSDDGIAAIVAAAGERVHGLGNVAGIMDDFAPVAEVSDAMWERVMAVNVTGPFRLMRALIPGMVAAGGGTVVNVTSEAGLRGAAAGTAYTTSKHALVGLTRSAATMYGPAGLRVNAVAPGGVATGMAIPGTNEAGMARLRPFHGTAPAPALPEALAASICFLLSEDSVNVNGAILPSDGGWSAA